MLKNVKPKYIGGISVAWVRNIQIATQEQDVYSQEFIHLIGRVLNKRLGFLKTLAFFIYQIMFIKQRESATKHIASKTISKGKGYLLRIIVELSEINY